jgi:pimeloyl-ACP methyl ester carboxylesterase
MRILTEILMRIGSVAALVLALFLFCVFWFQEGLIFFPEKLSADHRFQFSSPFEERILPIAGENIHSLLFREKETSTKGVVLFFHGNAGSLDGWGEVAAEILERTRWSVWILDYPGYGKSDGSISSEAQLQRIAQEFYENAQKEFGQVVVFGRSIGSGLAVKLAAENQVRALILETPYSSLQSLAKRIMPWLPGWFVASVLKYKLRSDLAAEKVKVPVLILHGTNDDLIPIDEAQTLSKRFPNLSQVQFVTLEGGGHNDLASAKGYWSALSDFLQSVKP